MITSLDGGSRIGPDLRPEHLDSYWQEYFLYKRQSSELHGLTERALLEIIARAKEQDRPHIDSAREINKLLTDLGTKHTFHRQFSEAFPGLRPPQILGMQLYELIAADGDIWTYMKTKSSGHVFPHSTYFLPR